MNNCPVCSNIILRHINRKHVYWYCSHCHQEVPNFSSIEIFALAREAHSVKLLENSVTNLIAL